jgi:hypothetical protein
MSSVIAMIGMSINLIKLNYVDICQYTFKKYLTDTDNREIFIIFLETDEICVFGTKFFNQEIKGEILFIKTYWDSNLQSFAIIPINYNDIPNLTDCIESMPNHNVLFTNSLYTNTKPESIDDNTLDIDMSNLNLGYQSTCNNLILSDQDRELYNDYYEKTGIEFF